MHLLAIQQTKGMVGFRLFWLVLVDFDQYDQYPNKAKQIHRTSIHVTVARTVLPV
jgi:hypothetical protein